LGKTQTDGKFVSLGPQLELLFTFSSFLNLSIETAHGIMDSLKSMAFPMPFSRYPQNPQTPRISCSVPECPQFKLT